MVTSTFLIKKKNSTFSAEIIPCYNLTQTVLYNINNYFFDKIISEEIFRVWQSLFYYNIYEGIKILKK